MLQVLKVINQRLEETGYDCFYNEKDSKTDYPFVIFNFPNSSVDEHREDIILEVDIWTKDQTECFVMTDIIDKKLSRYKYINDSVQLSIYRINRINNILDEDDTIKRNQLRYQIKTYFRNQ